MGAEGVRHPLRNPSGRVGRGCTTWACIKHHHSKYLGQQNDIQPLNQVSRNPARDGGGTLCEHNLGVTLPPHGEKPDSKCKARVEERNNSSESLKNVILLELHFFYSVSIFPILFPHLFLFCSFYKFILHELIFFWVRPFWSEGGYPSRQYEQPQISLSNFNSSFK